MKSNRNLIIFLSLGLFALGVTNYLLSNNQVEEIENVIFSDFVNKIEEGKIDTVFIKGYNIKGKCNDGSIFKTYIPFQDDSIIGRLLNNKVKIIAVPLRDSGPTFLDIFLSWFPTFLFIGVLLYINRMSLKGSLSKNKAQKAGNNEKITFEDVAGLEESKEEMKELILFLKEPKRFQKIGATIPKGVLLVGPPGNGKTLMARAIAGEANVPFFYMSGSSFVEMYVGVGAARVRELFTKAASQAPCLIFIDEIDAVGSQRGGGSDGGSKEFERTLNELLVGMDGFAPNSGVVVIAATNRAEILDTALMRRFERQIYIGYPDWKERESILKFITKKIKLDKAVDLLVLAKRTVGASASDLKTITNEAALLAARSSRDTINQKDFEGAIDRIYLGVEKKTNIITPEDKLLTAYHESGHAIVAYYSEGADPIHKVTIIPRGMALGMVSQLPDDKLHMTLEKLKSKLKVAAAGRVAENFKYGAEKITTGASSDIEYATALAWKMFTEWGFSNKLGPVKYDFNNVQGSFSISDKYKEAIMEEIKELLQWAQEEALKIIKKHEDKFELLTKTLIDMETLTGEQVKSLLETGEILKDENTEEIIEKPKTKRKKKEEKNIDTTENTLQ